MHTRCEVLVVKCRVLANWLHGVVQVAGTYSRFNLCARIAPPCAHGCAGMRIKDTRLLIPAAGRMCSRCADFSTTVASRLERTLVRLRG